MPAEPANRIDLSVAVLGVAALLSSAYGQIPGPTPPGPPYALVGACCRGTTCSVQSRTSCLALPSATWRGLGTTCVPHPCSARIDQVAGPSWQVGTRPTMLSGDGRTMVCAKFTGSSLTAAGHRPGVFLDAQRPQSYQVFKLNDYGQWTRSDLPANLGKPDAIDRRGMRIVGHLLADPARGYVYSTVDSSTILIPFRAHSYSDNSDVWGISPNGRFVVGNKRLSTTSPPVAVRWDTSTNLQYLLPGFSNAIEIRPTLCTDGGLAAGWVRNSSGTFAFRGSSTGDLPGGRTDARPRAISHDGGVMVGRGTSVSFLEFTTYHAFVWTGTGIRNINPEGPTNRLYGSGAKDCTADGKIVVGTMYEEFDVYHNARAFIWRQNEGTMKLRDYLLQMYPEIRPELGGLLLEHGVGISDDGRTFVGFDVLRLPHPVDARYESVEFLTWVVRLPDVRPFPAP